MAVASQLLDRRRVELVGLVAHRRGRRKPAPQAAATVHADVAHDVPLPAIETLARGFRDDTAALYTVLLRADVKELILRLDFNGWYSSDRT